MSYLLVPHGVSATGAKIWVAGVNESLDPVELVISPGVNYQVVNSVRKQWASRNGSYRLDYRRDTLAGLEPGKSYTIEARVKGEFKSDGKFRTLPAELPTLDQKPFTVLLGSCFCEAQDESGKLGNTFFHLPSGERPDVKIWAGDQVYLDSPWHYWSWHKHDAAELEVKHFENYQRAWFQTGTAAGFREALRDGANYFSSDDHEFWNNAPNWAALVRDSWREGGRKTWYGIARDLYGAFQADSATEKFTVGPLSFSIADTRMNRDADRTRFMLNEDIQEVGEWVANLKGPGVLVVGQPLFTAKKGLTGHVTDWNLPDYDQYGDFVRRLARSTHSLVVLTGDVHYGRVASCALKSGAELIEIISSPTALVDKSVGGSWHGAPAAYPAFDIPGVAKGPVETKKDFMLTDNHFLTLQFSAAGGRVKMVAKAWPIISPGTMPRSIPVYERLLQ